MTQDKWLRAAAVTITVAGVLGALFLVGRFALRLFLPFLIAFILAALTHRPAVRFAARTGAPQKAVAALMTLITLLFAGFFGYLVVERVLAEAQNLLSGLLADAGDPAGRLSQILNFLERLAERLFAALPWENDFLEGVVGDPTAFFAAQLSGWLSALSERIPALVGALLRATPSVLLFCLVTLVACFYFSVEYEEITHTLTGLFPPRWQARLPHLKQRLSEALTRYAKAYLLLFLITFFELFIGFLVLRVEYAFLLALLAALLDALPVLGVGTVLVPTALVSFALHDLHRGVGLLILYGVITVVRQITEPHLVGKSLGLHPMLTLVAFYAGVKIFGVAGVFIAPALLLCAKTVWKNGVFN
jgi:sporulation integral membrane protein YtvI